MKTTETIKTLRHGNPLNMFDRKEKLFVKIQLNRQEKFICWQRFVSKDRRNWINWNKYLSLKDVMQVRQQIIDNNNNP
jgi:hypothetical protein